LNGVKDHKKEVIELYDQFQEIEGQYDDTEHEFDRTMHWKILYKKSHANLLWFNKKEQGET